MKRIKILLGTVGVKFTMFASGQFASFRTFNVNPVGDIEAQVKEIVENDVSIRDYCYEISGNVHEHYMEVSVSEETEKHLREQGYFVTEAGCDYLEEVSSIIAQIFNHDNETSYGEPQAFIELPNDRSLEVVHEQDGLPEEEMFFSWRVHCSSEEADNNAYPNTCGIVNQAVSKDLTIDTCKKLVAWAVKVAEVE